MFLKKKKKKRIVLEVEGGLAVTCNNEIVYSKGSHLSVTAYCSGYGLLLDTSYCMRSPLFF